MIAYTEPSFEDERYRFARRDIREPVVDLVRDHGIETVVHLAYVVAPTHDKGQMEAVNLNGAANVLEACASADVSHLIHMSSTTVYGLHPDNDVPLTEESPLRASGDFTYAENKVQIERKVQQFAGDCPQTKVTVLRPCFVVGPGVSHPLVTHLQKKFVPGFRQGRSGLDRPQMKRPRLARYPITHPTLLISKTTVPPPVF